MNKQRRMVLASVIAIAALLGPLAGSASAEDKRETVVVFAASSLTDYVEKAWREFSLKRPEYKLSANYASSSALAKQIENAPMDLLFLSAHPKWTKYLIDRGIAREDEVLLGNELVIAAAGASPVSAIAIGRGASCEVFLPGRTAIGDPEGVPAGEYAKESLTALGWYGSLKGRLIPCASVRAALQALLAGEADRAIVFRTDLAGRKDASAIAVFPDDSHSPIVYTAAVVFAAKTVPAGPAAFLAFLQSKRGMAIARDLGFETGGDSP